MYCVPTLQWSSVFPERIEIYNAQIISIYFHQVVVTIFSYYNMTYCSTQQGKSSMYQIICPTHLSTELKDDVANDNSRTGNKRNVTQQRGWC